MIPGAAARPGADTDAEQHRRPDVHRARRRAGPDLTGNGHRVIDRYRETLSARAHLVGHRRRGDHADDLSGAVHQRTAGVSRPHIGRNLDQPVDFLRATRQRVFGVDGPVERGHRAGFVGEGSAHPAGVAETDGRLAHRDLTGVADGRGRQPSRAAQLEHRDVVLAVIADEIGRVVAPAHGAGDCVGARDDVVVRQHHAAGIDDGSGSGSDRLLVVDLRGDLDDGRLDRRGGRRRIGRGRPPPSPVRPGPGPRRTRSADGAVRMRACTQYWLGVHWLSKWALDRDWPAPCRTRSTMRSPNCSSTVSPVSRSLPCNGAIRVSRSKPASVSGRSSPRAMPRSTTGRNALSPAGPKCLAGVAVIVDSQ